MTRLSLVPVLTLVAVACGTVGGAESAWQGTIDTLASGTIAVTNPATGVWHEATAWRVVEELRIGTLEGEGPDLFGSVTSLAVDPAGRIYVMEGQAQELRVFDAAGAHVRTVGRKGGGPGEFAHAANLEWGPDSLLWVTDPQNNRISLFDTAGGYVGSHRTAGGFIMSPWPGGFDDAGYLYSPVPLRGQGPFRWALVKYDRALTPLDTIVPPQNPLEGQRFEMRSDGMTMMASVPFTPSLVWRLDPAGGFWAMLTGEYRLFRVDAAGDTVRTITRAYDPLPVTEADIDRAIERLEWFVSQGGKVDRSRFPSTKPATRTFFLDDTRHIWVERFTDNAAARGQVFDIFDPEGRYLGEVRLPFAIELAPAPLIKDGQLIAVTEDDLEVPYVVRARVVKPE